MRPLEHAYNEYMRTYTGCMKSTPIPVLQAISKFPFLIMTDSALTVIKAEAQNNILGEDYRKWDQHGCLTDGWTPFGLVRKAIEQVKLRVRNTPTNHTKFSDFGKINKM